MKKAISLILAAAIVAALVPALMLTASAYSDEVPIIESAPKNLCWPEGSLASYQCVCSNDKGHEKFDYNWYIYFEGKEYPIGFGSKSTDPWRKYVDFTTGNTGTVGNVVMLDKVKKGLDGSLMRCTVSGKSSSSTVYFRIMVGDSTMFSPPEITAPVLVTCNQDDDITLSVSGKPTSGNVTEKKDFITYLWYESSSVDIFDIKAIIEGDKDFTDKTYKPDTSSPGVYYYFCGVFDGAGETMANYSYTNAIIVEVLEKVENVSMEVSHDPDKTEYFVGENFDPKGMTVRVWRSDGYLDLHDGDKLTFSPSKFNKAGNQTVKITYEDIDTTITVKVKEKAVPHPQIKVQPKGGEFEADQECSLLIKAEAPSGKVYYQWYKNGKNDVAGASPIEGATAQLYIPPRTVGTTYYFCRVTSDEDSAGIDSNIAAVTYKAAQTSEADTSGEPVADTTEELTADPGPDTEDIGSDTAEVSDSATAEATGTNGPDSEKEPATTSAGRSGKAPKGLVIALISVASVLLLSLAGTITALAIVAKKKKNQ